MMMKRFNSPAIVAILLALIVYVGIIIFLYGITVHHGHTTEKVWTRSQLNGITWNVEQLLYTTSDNGTSYISSFGQVHRDSMTYLSRLVLTQQDYQRLRSQHFASTLKHFVNSSTYMADAFFCFEPNVFGSKTYQPFYHHGDSTLRNTDELQDFYHGPLYQKVKNMAHSWWYVPQHHSTYNEPILSCCTPIYLEDTTHFIGVFVMDYSLGSLNEYINECKPYNNSTLFVINSENHIIASTDSTYFGYAVEDMPEWNTTSFGNEEVAFTYLPWRLRMYTPLQEVEQALLAFLNKFLLYGFIGLIIISICLFFAVRSINRSRREQHIIESELQMAGAIQRALLPDGVPVCNEIQIDALLRPAREVAGDLYEVQHIDHYIYFMIGDVSGKGMQASIMMAMMSGLFRHEVRRNILPSAIMNELNKSLVARNPNMLFCTMLIGRLNQRTGELHLCNAGHNPPIHEGKLLPLKPNIVLGVIADYTYKNEVYQLTPQQTLLCYTDGVTEAMNRKNQFFGEERLLSLGGDIHTILRDVDTFADGQSQADDITLLSLTYSPFTMRDVNDTSRLRDYVDGKSAIQLPIEELAVNALTHGKAHWVTVSVYEQDNIIHATLVDDGEPFDPTLPPVTNNLTDDINPEIGGKGLLIVQQMVHLHYSRKHDLNCVEMTW